MTIYLFIYLFAIYSANNREKNANFYSERVFQPFTDDVDK